MSISISSADLGRLENLLQVFLTPVDHARPDAWCARACDAFTTAFDAAGTAFYLPGDGGPSIQYSNHAPGVVETYLDRFASRDLAVARIMEHRLEVAHPRAVPGLTDQVLRSEMWSDLLVPNHLTSFLMLSVFSGPRPGPRMYCSIDCGPDDPRLATQAALARAAMPAFRAGLESWTRLAPHGPALPTVLDAIPEAVVLCDRTGRALHANARMSRLLGDEPARDAIREEVAALARAAGARFLGGPGRGEGGPFPSQAAVRTAGGSYRLSATLVDEGVFGTEPVVLVVVESSGARVLGGEELRERFGLTPKQVEVAHLIAEGLSNREIARRLCISPHTAKNHTEHVMAKLAVTTRARVGALLRGDVE